MCHSRTLRRASRRLQRLYEASLAPCGLRSIEYAMLAEIDERGTVPLADFARDYALDPSSLRYKLEPLIGRDLIALEKDQRDRRSRIMRLTDAGRAKVAEGKALWFEAQDRFEAALGPERAQSLRAMLRTVASPDFDEAFRSV